MKKATNKNAQNDSPCHDDSKKEGTTQFISTIPLSNNFNSLEKDAHEQNVDENLNITEKIIETHRSEKNNPFDLSDLKALLAEYWKSAEMNMESCRKSI